MRNARPDILIATSVLVGLVAVLTAAQWVKNTSHLATTKVVVAARDLEAGTRVDASMLQVVEFPAATTLVQSFSDPEVLAGRIVLTRITRGEPLLATKIASVGEKAGLAATLGPGRRAMTVKLNDVSSVAGFALPGSYVDLLVHTTDDNNKPLSKIVLERVLVLAVEQETSAGDKSKMTGVGSVTLDVSPKQSEQVDLARSVGSLSLALRNNTDEASAATVGAHKSDILGTASALSDPAAAVARAAPVPAPAVKVAARPRVVEAKKPQPAPTESFEVIRGSKKSVEQFPAEANPT
jgi:pilus assembly protein CpaB